MSTEAFRGLFHQKVDNKARVSIPAALRRKLEIEDPVTADHPRPRIVMVYGGKRRKFVECYSMLGAATLSEMVETMPLGSKDRDKAERDLIMQSAEIEIDDDGRIVLPIPVREKMGFGPNDLDAGGMASFAGVTNRFKLYRQSVWASEMAALDDEDDEDDGDPLAAVSKYAKAG